MPERRFEVTFGEQAIDYLAGLPERVYERVSRSLTSLANHPYLGHRYDPAYEATLPPVECRRLYVPRTSVELYYFVDDDLRKVVVFWADDSRTDPRHKFLGLHNSDLT